MCNPCHNYMHVTGYPVRHRDSLHFLWGRHLQCIVLLLCLVRFFMNQSFINNLSRFIGGFTHSATLGNFCPHSYAHTCAPSQVPVRTTSKIAWLFNQSLLYLCKNIYIIATVIFFFYWALRRFQTFTAIFQVHTRKTKTNVATRGDSM